MSYFRRSHVSPTVVTKVSDSPSPAPSTTNVSNPPQLPKSSKADENKFQFAVEQLEKGIRRNRSTALLAGSAGVIGLAVAGTLGYLATKSGSLAIEKNPNSVTLALFELIRAAAGAALLGAFAWGMLNLARAALDQSTRFEKRMIAGNFLVYVLTMFEDEIKAGTISMTDTMSVFKAWSDSVDSAFTHVKFGSKRNQALSLAATKDGVSVATGGAEASPIPEQSQKKAA